MAATAEIMRGRLDDALAAPQPTLPGACAAERGGEYRGLGAVGRAGRAVALGCSPSQVQLVEVGLVGH